jgi:hypothetical protein
MVEMMSEIFAEAALISAMAVTAFETGEPSVWGHFSQCL